MINGRQSELAEAFMGRQVQRKHSYRLIELLA